MRKRTWFALSITTLAAAMALPLMAQSFVLKANIPFEFTVGNKVLPAGEYSVKNDGGSSTLFLQGETSNAAALTLAQRKYLLSTKEPAGLTKLTFDRYGNRYFLSEVDNGYTGSGVTLPMSHAQRELAKTASVQHEEIVAVLAQR